jgi:2-polyprenyl-3-methyl-5-hydroxy-6-metoxy-1,4-benzoquinol methylase
MSKNYCIHENYISRQEFLTCDQAGHTDKFQDEVYYAANSLFREKGYETLLDIGCGSAYKLLKYFNDKKFVGLDLEPNLSYIREKYPLCDFRESDFKNPPKEKFDVILCSDVIEHLLDPDELLNFISNIEFKHLVLSTPERGVIQKLQRSFGWDVLTNGPPHNKMHIREWSFGELKSYLSEWFNIEYQFMTPSQVECQVVIATPKKKL